MSRKTFEVDTLKAKINNMILNSCDADIAGRATLAALLGDILHESDNYKGFNYLTPDMMAASVNGKSIGVDHDQDNIFANTDQTRVFYY